MIHASLFTGIGGFDLAAEWINWTNLFHCEWIESKQQHLKSKFPNTISYGDISQTDFTIHRGRVDVLTGGFPCQDASIAKQDGEGQQGLSGARTGLAFEMLRAIDEIRPKYVIAENVAHFLKIRGGADARTILGKLAGLGYNAEWRICRASEVGAPHHRARLYIIAYSNSIRLSEKQTFFSHVAEERLPFEWKPYGTAIQIARANSWNGEPPILCLDDGLSIKLDAEHIHGYGNAVVPQIPFKIFQAIQEYENQHRTPQIQSH